VAYDRDFEGTLRDLERPVLDDDLERDFILADLCLTGLPAERLLVAARILPPRDLLRAIFDGGLVTDRDLAARALAKGPFDDLWRADSARVGRAADWFIGRIPEATRLLVTDAAVLEARLDPRDNDDPRDVDRWRDVDGKVMAARWWLADSQEDAEWRLETDGERLRIEWGRDLDCSHDADLEPGNDLKPVDNLEKAAELVFSIKFFVAMDTRLFFAAGLSCAEQDRAAVLFVPVIALDAPFTLDAAADLEDREGLSPAPFFLVGSLIFLSPDIVRVFRPTARRTATTVTQSKSSHIVLTL